MVNGSWFMAGRLASLKDNSLLCLRHNEWVTMNTGKHGEHEEMKNNEQGLMIAVLIKLRKRDILMAANNTDPCYLFWYVTFKRPAMNYDP